MDPEYLTIAKLGGTIIIPNSHALAEEMFGQLANNRMLFYSLTKLHPTTQRAVLICRVPLSIDFDGYVYKMKKGDTLFLEINNE